MSKLTNSHREAIARDAVSNAFDAKAAVLFKEADALAREAYATLFTRAELAHVAALKPDWFRQDACLRFNVGGQDIRLCLEGDSLSVPAGENNWSCSRLGTIQPGDLCDRIQAHAAAVEKCWDDRRAADRAVKVVLGSANTFKQLKQVWPEGDQFYSKYTDVAVSTLPAVQTHELNTMLGLA